MNRPPDFCLNCHAPFPQRSDVTQAELALEDGSTIPVDVVACKPCGRLEFFIRA